MLGYRLPSPRPMLARWPTRRGFLMLVRRRLPGLLLLVLALMLALILAGACARPAAETTAPSPAKTSPTERPAWLSLPLANARTGEAFTLADLGGKTVYVEPMATWCTNCRQQMGTIRDQLVGRLDPARTVLV